MLLGKRAELEDASADIAACWTVGGVTSSGVCGVAGALPVYRGWSGLLCCSGCFPACFGLPEGMNSAGTMIRIPRTEISG
jgi:hypothetical protein